MSVLRKSAAVLGLAALGGVGLAGPAHAEVSGETAFVFNTLSAS